MSHSNSFFLFAVHGSLTLDGALALMWWPQGILNLFLSVSL